MWKAIIKLIEKWAYRCEHDWERLEDVDSFDRDRNDSNPYCITRSWRCKKCCEIIEKTV